MLDSCIPEHEPYVYICFGCLQIYKIPPVGIKLITNITFTNVLHLCAWSVITGWPF